MIYRPKAVGKLPTQTSYNITIT